MSHHNDKDSQQEAKEVDKAAEESKTRELSDEATPGSETQELSDKDLEEVAGGACQCQITD